MHLVWTLALSAIPADAPRELRLGEALSVHIDAAPTSLPVFRVRVPPRATALRVITRGASRDVDLYGAYQAQPEPASGAYDVHGEGTWIDEEILIDTTDAMPLEPGDWYFVVAPSENTIDPGPIDVELLARLVDPPRVELRPGVRTELVLERAAGLRVAIAPITGGDATETRWRLEAFSSVADIDVLVGPGLRGGPHRLPWARSETALSYERIELEPDWLQRGALVHVYGRPQGESLDRVPVQVLLSAADTPLQLVPAPQLPGPTTDPFVTAIAATVSIFGALGGGSGVVLSTDGLVITNAHVIADALEGEKREPPACGFTLDPRRPPVPTFRLEVVERDLTLDLALLRITGTLDGKPLPPGLRFPTLPLGSTGELGLGASLFGVGYPMTGGAGSFVTVTLTRGILSGFSTEREGLLLKTDAAVHSGISGGAVLDERGRLVAIPSSSISDANLAGGLGFALPIETLPEHWLRRITSEK